MESKTCGSCKFFRQHYIRYSDGRYFTIEQGHCVEPRLKNRLCGGKVCDRFKEKQAK